MRFSEDVSTSDTVQVVASESEDADPLDDSLVFHQDSSLPSPHEKLGEEEAYDFNIGRGGGEGSFL